MAALELTSAGIYFILICTGFVISYQLKSKLFTALTGFALVCVAIMLYGNGLSWENGITYSYGNVTEHRVIHSCVDSKNDSWDEVEFNNSDCGGAVTEWHEFKHYPQLQYERKSYATRNNRYTDSLAIIAAILGLFYAATAIIPNFDFRRQY